MGTEAGWLPISVCRMFSLIATIILVTGCSFKLRSQADSSDTSDSASESFLITTSSPTYETSVALSTPEGLAFTQYCILENNTDSSACTWIDSDTIPSTATISATEGAKVLSLWVRDSNGTISSRYDSNSIVWSWCAGDRLTATPYAGGSGVSGDPYLICTPEQMNRIGSRADLSSYFRLKTNIDLSDYSGTSYNVIGSSGTPFSGDFDGGGNEIRNFEYLGGATSFSVGLFGGVSGAVHDLKVLDANVTGNFVGIITGNLSPSNASGIIYKVQVSGNVAGVGHGCAVGGIAGSAGQNGNVSESRSDANLSSSYDNAQMGGLAGVAFKSYFTDSYTTGSVVSTGDDPAMGGLVGFHTQINVGQSYSLSLISGETGMIGGLLGSPDAGENPVSLNANFWNTQTSGLATSFNQGAGQVEGATTSQLQDPSFFASTAFNDNGVWIFASGQYPKLYWE